MSTSKTIVSVSQARPEHIGQIHQVIYHSWLATYPNETYGVTREDIEDRFMHRDTPASITDRWERLMNPPLGETTLVAMHTDVVGVCRVVKNLACNKLALMYVLPEHHRSGIGKALWQEARAYLDLNKPVFVDVAVYNERAISFYQSLGFKATGRRFVDPEFTLKSGAFIPELQMRLEPLSAP